LDNKRQWYRYHALFAKALRYRLGQTHADLVLVLHHRASLWYAKHDRTTQAILHAFRAKEWQWAADLIEQKSLQVTTFTWGASEHELILFRQWFEQLPLDVVGSRPRLCVTCVHLLMQVAPVTMLKAWLEVAEATLTASLATASREISEQLVTHPDVDKIAFTGSTAVGKRVASLCGEALKHVSCELGGKSAAILLDDVMLDHIITPLIYAVLPNNGQTCIAQTRILVPQNRYDEITEALIERVRALNVGNPLDPKTEIGPLVTQYQRDRVEGYIASGLAEGAKIVLGGGRPTAMTKGWFVEPTIFVDVKSSMSIA
jgi:hypothetical protein